MKYPFIRPEVKDFVNKVIKPKYKTFDKAHNLSHFKFVTENCVDYASEIIKTRGEDINLEIAYMVGALHDIGIEKGREGHAKSSGEFVRNCERLKDFYTSQEIELIAQAVEDHSSHLDYEPRSIYGKIVADADRNNSMYLVFSRPVKFGIKNEPEYSREEQIERVYQFVNKKFGRNGYVHYWLGISKTTKEQQQVWDLLDKKPECLAYIAGIYDEVTKGER